MVSRRQDRAKDVPGLLAQAQQTIERARWGQAKTEQIFNHIYRTDNPGFTFLVTDLDLGATFARIAAKAQEGSDRRGRNQALARRAFDVISRLSQRVLLSDNERENVDGKLARLRSALEQLGEVFRCP